MTASQKEQAALREQEFSALCAAYPALDLARGRRAYERQCVSCHQSNGNGTPSAIPPLRGHVPALLHDPDGRRYLAEVAVHGLAGAIDVHGTIYESRMPAHGPLYNDDDLVLTLAYVSLMWGNDALRDNAPLVDQQDIALARKERKTGKAVRQMRPHPVRLPPS